MQAVTTACVAHRARRRESDAPFRSDATPAARLMHLIAGSSVDALLLFLGIFGDELQQPHRISVRPA